MRAGIAAPPRGRGSTLEVPGEGATHRGSPAWAGIDPGVSAARCPTGGLPRVGGDRPIAVFLIHVAKAAPPRGRGSTRRGCALRASGCGSPAWAGIDPHAASSASSLAWLPRVGGDRPKTRGVAASSREAPPRGRGSTPRDDPTASRGGGSPAWAGIDPKRSTAVSARVGLPRVGGDRPVTRVAHVAADLAPPRGRGSTRDALQALIEDVGSPAWAGIDPDALVKAMTRVRLPRVGGDRPPVTHVATLEASAPPRGRGSTRRERYGVRGALGSPAWAGIDPLRRCSSDGSARLPRVGGDRPCSVITADSSKGAPPRGRGSTRIAARLDAMLRGSPAWAGIDPVSVTRGVATARLPRVGGDRPASVTAHVATQAAPPRGRGSTRDAAYEALRVYGSPAWAGIDPATSTRTASPSRLPRVGGDRPSAAYSPAAACAAPPRGRGSTQVVSDDARHEHGSPAWAGIDPRQRARERPHIRLPRVGGDRPAITAAQRDELLAPPRGRGSTLLGGGVHDS